MTTKKRLFTPNEKKNIYILSLILFFRMFSVFLVLPVFNYLAGDLDFATPALIGLAFGAYALTQGLFQIPFGLFSDIFGRKNMLLIGLFLFSAGSLVVALTDNIYLVIAGRFIQGVGAISSVIFAYIADITRPEVRSGANAFLGMSIGLSFILAFLIAPTLSIFIGFSGLFYGIFILSLCAIAMVIFVMPTDKPQKQAPKISHYLLEGLKQKQLYEIYFGSFVVGMCMTFFMFNVQTDYKLLNFPKEDLWMIYLPVILVSAPVMFIAAFTAQKYYRFKEVIFIGILVLLSSLGVYYFAVGYQLSLFSLIAALFLFFVGFNMFEPIFPSLLTIKCSKHTKGTVSGIFNFFSFFGNFLGASVSGYFYETHRNIPIYIIAACLLLFMLLNIGAKNPIKALKTA